MITYNKADKTLDNIARIAEDRLKGKYDITLLIDDSLSEFEGKIEDGVISAGSYSQLLYLLGKYARNPGVKNGVYRSNKEVCGMYFASHNRNFYEKASLEEIFEHIDDLALWGMNTLQMWFDMFYFENMEAGREYAERLMTILRYAKSIGVKTVICILANESFTYSPEHLRADWTAGHDGYIHKLQGHYHVEICPSVEGGMEKILEYRREWLEVFKDADADFISIGAYDQGGCSCSKCAPWGCNGFIRVCEELIPLINEYLPKAKIIISLWQFDTFTGTTVEHEGMKKALLEGKFKDVPYLMSEPQYARFPYEQGMPKPLIGFPEISMCDTIPWGGYGTNPIPSLLQSLMDTDLDKQEGGLPYSEGFYEEINKIIMLRYYRDGQSARDSVVEYLTYEFGLKGEILEKTCQAIYDMEETLHRGFEPGHRYPVDNPEKMPEIEKAILEADATLPDEIRNGRKWQMIYLRAVIDGELYRNDFKRNKKVLEYFKKIIDLCHLETAEFIVKPDIIEDDKYGRVLTRKELTIIARGGTID